jgi:transposase|tara:strand:- start:1241 stop:2860 length:1620 start_codon:yes stop_codon:yes gene_type:complete
MKIADLNTLPDDPAVLKKLLSEQSQTLHQKDTQLLEKETELTQTVNLLQQKTEQLDALQEQVNLLLHRRFGRSSEHYSPDQLGLFNEAEEALDDVEIDDDTTAEDSVIVEQHQRRKKGRKPLPASLPRIEIIHDLADDEKFCPHDDHPLHRIGESSFEELEIVPAVLKVYRHIRIKYGCRHCETGVYSAPLPPSPIPKSIATPGLLAYIAVSKYLDALPLYRQEQMFKRIGVKLSRTTMAMWMIRVGEILEPVLTALAQQLLASAVVHMDETRIQVLHVDGEPKKGLSQMWARVNGDSDRPIILFDFDPTRSAAVPLRLMADYQGYLVTDGYKGYAAILRQPGVLGAGCWAHARRKFDEAIKSQGKPAKSGKAHQGLAFIQQLYRIERQIREQPPDERKRIRLAKASPLLDKIKAWLVSSIDEVPPRSKLGIAINYLATEWDHLGRYLEDGRVPIDNNRCENAIRPFVVGRKNWLFANTDNGAKASAAIYSVIETAKANGLDPYQYLRYLLTELPKGQHQHIEDLLPFNLTPESIKVLS